MNDYLIHYGVKGMKWGVRKQRPYEGIGRRRRSIIPNQNGLQRHRLSRTQYRRRQNIKKIAKGAAIVTGGVLVAVGGYQVSKILRTPAGRQAISKGSEWAKRRIINATMRSRNVRRSVRAITKVPRAGFNRLPPVRAARFVKRTATAPLKAPLKVVGRLPGGRTALTALGTATVVSDINSTKQFIEKSKAQKEIRKTDVKDLAIDLINPYPDNLPKIRKRGKN